MDSAIGCTHSKPLSCRIHPAPPQRRIAPPGLLHHENIDRRIVFGDSVEPRCPRRHDRTHRDPLEPVSVEGTTEDVVPLQLHFVGEGSSEPHPAQRVSASGQVLHSAVEI